MVTKPEQLTTFIDITAVRCAQPGVSLEEAAP